MGSWNDVDSGECSAASLFGRGSGACSHDRHSVNVLPTKAEPLEQMINGVALPVSRGNCILTRVMPCLEVQTNGHPEPWLRQCGFTCWTRRLACLATQMRSGSLSFIQRQLLHWKTDDQGRYSWFEADSNFDVHCRDGRMTYSSPN
jgi:hypothetical protein